MPWHPRILQIVFAIALLGGVPLESQQSGALDRLPLGIQLTRPIEGAKVDRLAVPLTVQQFVKIVVMQTGRDVIVTLFDPQKRVLMTSDLPNSTFGAETVAAISESAGEYSVEVKLANPIGGKGSYQVVLATEHDATPEDRDLASAYQTLSQADVLRGKHTAEARRQAADLLNRIGPYFAKSGDLYSQAWTVTMMGSMLAESGDMRAALRYAEEAAGLFQEAGDLHGEAIGRNNMGGMLDVLGEPAKALESYGQALALDRATGDGEREATVRNNIGKLDAEAGNWQGALENYQQALPLAREIGDTRTQGVLTHNIGFVNTRLGNFEEALAILQQALLLRRAARDRRGEGETLQMIANNYDASKQPGKALEYLDEALAIEIALGDRRKEAEIRRDLGRTYAELGRLSEAEMAIRQALDEERTVQDRRGMALAMLYLGRVLMLESQPAAASQQAEQALAEFRAIGDRSSQASALESIARAESDRGNLAAARERLEEALRLTEDNRTHADSEQLRASFFATRQDSYGFFIDLLMRLGDAGAALETSERSRARSMLDMLADSGSGIREGVDPKLLERERDVTNTLNAKGSRLLALAGNAPQAPTLRQEIRDLESQYQDVEAAIRKDSPRYAALAQPSPLTAAQIQRDLLDEDTLLLEYSLGEKRSYLWTVDKKDLRAWELPARDKIEAQVEQVSGLLTARSIVKRLETPATRQKRITQADAALGSAVKELSRMVIGPAEGVLAAKQLVVVPDGALQRLPFSILPVGKGEPLVVAHEVVMLPSASAMAVLRRETSGRKPAPKTLAVFADPVFDGTDARAGKTVAYARPTASQDAARESTRILEHLAEPSDSASASLKIPRLPYTAQEADEILGVFRGGANLKAVGFEASRAAATNGQLSDYRYLHFATHGYLDTERPSLSALVLSQVDQNNQPLDGFLRVNDIYNTRLSADLVVLSACQTGLGKEVRGEGLMGLTRAFLYAGAPRVIVSLWNVNDRATAELMTKLYRNMLREDMRPAAALRAAQLEMRKQKRWESPYYWAAFVQHGEWR